eukprot:8648664-Pyramimonas_sp.AAC.1
MKLPRKGFQLSLALSFQHCPVAARYVDISQVEVDVGVVARQRFSRVDSLGWPCVASATSRTSWFCLVVSWGVDKRLLAVVAHAVGHEGRHSFLLVFRWSLASCSSWGWADNCNSLMVGVV